MIERFSDADSDGITFGLTANLLCTLTFKCSKNNPKTVFFLYFKDFVIDFCWKRI